MADREAALRTLAVGDIFHGRSPNGASLVCLVTAVSETTIVARRIPTQEEGLEFDRRTGVKLGTANTRIDCVAPLPPEVKDVLLARDQKGRRLAAMWRNGIKPGLDQYRLTEADLRASRLFREHVAANPI